MRGIFIVTHGFIELQQNYISKKLEELFRLNLLDGVNLLLRDGKFLEITKCTIYMVNTNTNLFSSKKGENRYM